MWARTILLWGFLGLTAIVTVTGRAVAELLTALFPDGVPGYDRDDGVTVQTRLHPEQMPLGIRQDGWQFSPRLDEAMGYTSNAGFRRGSWELVSTPVLGVASGWSRDAVGALVSLADTRFLSLPAQDRTDVSAAVGGRLEIGRDALTLAVQHANLHEDRSQIGAIASDRPVAVGIDEMRASYDLGDGPWRIAPGVRIGDWRYSGTTVLGVPTSQSYRDRVVTQAETAIRYELAPLRELLLELRTVTEDYTATPSGQRSPNSVRYQVLAGMADDDAVWRWRLLLGDEVRDSVSYGRQNTVIAEAGAGWSPSGLTSVTATVSRETQDAAQEGVSGLVATAVRLGIDHEYQRDLILHLSAGLQRADFFQGGYQTATAFGVGLTRVLNRSAQLSVTYDQTDLRGSATVAGAQAVGYSRGVALITLRLAR